METPPRYKKSKKSKPVKADRLKPVIPKYKAKKRYSPFDDPPEYHESVRS